jgi:hypothetical protein
MAVMRSLLVLPSGILLLFLASTVLGAADYPKGTAGLKLERAKMASVSFSHESHAGKAKVACARCHHADPQAPKACTTCHQREAQEKKVGARDAFHETCIDCHKDVAAKGAKAPVKCNECHKK